jgi:hypothetical protein
MAVDFPDSPSVNDEFSVDGVTRIWTGTAWVLKTSGGGSARTTATITTASLAHNATEDSTVVLAAGYRLLQITTDRACRVRLYTTSAKRTADAARSTGVDPTGDHGLMFEFVAVGAVTDYDLTPTVDGFCPAGTSAYYAIENRSGSTSAVEVTLGWIRTE